MTSGDDTCGTDAATTLDAQPAGGVDDVAAHDEAELAAVLGGPSEAQAEYRKVECADAPRTRDLLSAVAEREHTVPRHAGLERRERGFVRWLLLAIVVALAVLFAALWWLDPISVTGRQTRFSIVENGGVRQAKLDLMQELDTPPGVLVLGSSRSMKLNPQEIQEVSGQTAFNGGVSGGTTQDIYLYTRYAEELWGRGEDADFPHLVIGVVPDVFRFTGTAALDPRLKKFLPRAQTDTDHLEQAKELLQLKTLEAAARSVRRVTKRDGLRALLHPADGAGRIDAALATTGKQRGNQRENLDPRGMQLFDPGGDDSAPLRSRVEVQMRGFARSSYVADADFTGVDDRGLALLKRTIALANRHGDVPTLWVTPYAPGAVQYLPPELYESRDRRFRAAIQKLQDEGTLKFEFEDFADISKFGGSPTDWHDGIHMKERNTERVIAELDRRNVLD